MRREAYDRDGFVLAPKVFGVEDVDRLGVEADRMLDERASGRTWSGSWRDENASYSLLTVGDLHRHSEVFRDAGHDARLLGVVSELIGPCQLVAAMLIVKPPENGQPFPLHQDSAYYSGKEHAYCIAVLHLDAATSESGALRFLPGVHREKNIGHLNSERKSYLDPAAYSMADTVEVPAKAGDVVCFNIHTPHASGVNTSKYRRAVVRYGYIPKQAA